MTHVSISIICVATGPPPGMTRRALLHGDSVSKVN
jgi:hypothetical protein